MEKIVIIGASGLGRETAEVLTASKRNIIGYIDDNLDLQGKIINGIPVLGGLNWLEECDATELYAVIGIGNPRTRKKIAEQVNIPFTTAIHPDTSIGESVIIYPGTVICAGSRITCNIELGNHVFVNLNCTIGHDTIIEDYVTLAPGVHIAGNVVLKTGSHIYTGATIAPYVTLGEWSIVGTQSAVLNSVSKGITVVGVPAKEKS